jgi:enamine deaminase RidA (YjgF/YER057c/UK114 family)
VEKKYVKPDNVFTPTGYSHAVAVDGARRLIFVAGQVARDQRGVVISGDLKAQTRQACRNLLAVLAAAGANASDVVKLTTFVVKLKPKDRAIVLGVRNEFFDVARLPASSLIGVDSLVEPEMLVEIEAIAAIS